MKTRHGFVSNSSSSSFIVGIAKISDVQYTELKVQFSEDVYDAPEILTADELIEQASGKWSNISIRDGRVTVSGGGNSGADATIDFDYTKKYIIFNINNNEGDHAFIGGGDPDDDYPECNYDIDLSWFDEKQQKIYEMIFNTPGSSIVYGAERNG